MDVKLVDGARVVVAVGSLKDVFPKVLDKLFNFGDGFGLYTDGGCAEFALLAGDALDGFGGAFEHLAVVVACGEVADFVAGGEGGVAALDAVVGVAGDEAQLKEELEGGGGLGGCDRR